MPCSPPAPRPVPPGARSTRALVAACSATVLVAGLTGVPGTAAAARGDRPVLVRLTADDGTVRSAEVPLGRGVHRLRTARFSQVAAIWTGPAPRISVRPGRTGPWHRLAVLEDGPDRSAEGEPGVRGTDLLWTGPTRGVDVRVRGRARDVELVLIDPGTSTADASGRSAPSATSPRRAARKADRAPRPRLLTRRRWGADDSWRNGEPVYLDRLKQVHLHHTATGNRYRRRDVPGIIRGMYRYHTQSLGWFDLGYNFVVDKFGRTWVGRSGGANRLVQGAHTLGFNHASVGVAVIGNYERRGPRREVVGALVRLAAWKLDRHRRRAAGKVRVRSTGSDKYPDGTWARLPAFDGHRDTNDTACPGQQLYDRLPALRRRAQRRIDRFS